MNKRISRCLASDNGMSLTELMVVLVLLGVILASSYAAQQAISMANALAERQATLVQQITNPLLTMEKIIMQNRELKGGSGAYTMVATTDRDLDGNYELHTLSAGNDGTIRLLTQVLNNDGTINRTIQNGIIGRYNTNNPSSGTRTPMFTYFDVDGNVIPSSDDYPDLTRSVSLTIKATSGGESLVESRTIQFRNRD